MQTRIVITSHRFWEPGIRICNTTTQQKFLTTFHIFLNSVVQQAADRDHSSIRNIEDYFDLRRLTVGAMPCFALIAMKMDIPNEILEHPTLEALRIACTDIIHISNDIYSYNVECVPSSIETCTGA